MEFSRQEQWNVLLCPPPGDLPDPRIKPPYLMSPGLAHGFFIIGTTWEAQEKILNIHKLTSMFKLEAKEQKLLLETEYDEECNFFFFLVNLIFKIFFLLCLIHFLEQERVLLTQVNSSTYEKKSNQDHMFEVRPSKYPGTIVKLDLIGIHECLDCLFSVENRK